MPGREAGEGRIDREGREDEGPLDVDRARAAPAEDDLDNVRQQARAGDGREEERAEPDPRAGDGSAPSASRAQERYRRDGERAAADQHPIGLREVRERPEEPAHVRVVGACREGERRVEEGDENHQAEGSDREEIKQARDVSLGSRADDAGTSTAGPEATPTPSRVLQKLG